MLIEHHGKQLSAPTVNLNGTDRDALIDEYYLAYEKLYASLDAISQITVHGRDWQTVPAGSPDTLARARNQQREWMQQIVVIREELAAIYNALYRDKK